ncbi:hypothetical protein OV203_18285 [Nannocystis sp. ILAH1]|uniref:hypothetical protein n=1 Tax=Nannocystis sp. ILAH1 TaxID=2996789 RepID=UPI00226E8EC7|nr:hypothetical protein [Nannocystis sp. ILAH1]MCY0989091.1 hypothetical protein [Nannocystis sp. ILAH1]
MKRDVPRLLVGPGLVVVLALACDRQSPPYCDSLEGLARRLPEPGATDVPANARLWVNLPGLEFEDIETLELVGPDGPVELMRSIVDTNFVWNDYREAPGLDLWIFTPVEPLAPGLHEVVGGHSDWSFTVVDAVDDEPPPIPEVESIGYTSERDEGEASIGLTMPQPLVVLEQEGQAGLDPLLLSGEIGEVWSGDWLRLGRGLCLNNWAAQAGSHTRVRLSAFDVAGNHSGFGEWIDLDVPDACSVSSSRPPPLLLLLLALFGRRRKARHTSRE